MPANPRTHITISLRWQKVLKSHGLFSRSAHFHRSSSRLAKTAPEHLHPTSSVAGNAQIELKPRTSPPPAQDESSDADSETRYWPPPQRAVLTNPCQTATLAAGLSAFVYSRASLLRVFYSNAPGRLTHINNVKNLQVKFADQIRNCEDCAIDTHEGFALLSCDPGRDLWNTVMVSV